MPSDYPDRVDPYRKALLLGLSPDSPYQPDLDLLDEALAQSESLNAAAEYLREARSKRDRKTDELRQEFERTPASGGEQEPYYEALLRELANARRAYDEVYKDLYHLEFELRVLKWELENSSPSEEYVRAAETQERRWREVQDAMIAEKLLSLHKKVFEINEKLAKKREKMESPDV